MNKKGQSHSVFRLIVFAIILIALLLAIAQFFQENKKSVFSQIKQLIENAKLNEGKSHSKQLLIEQATKISANLFESPSTNIAFKCSSIQCQNQNTTIENKNAFFNEKTQIIATARCEIIAQLYSCFVFFGDLPAQIQLNLVQTKKENDLTTEKPKTIIEIENTGKLNATNISISLQLLKKNENQQFEKYSNPIIQTIEQLAPGEKKMLSIFLPVQSNGNFLLEVTATSIDAGKDKKSTEFSAKNLQTNSNCTALSQETPFFSFEENKCITRFLCTDCQHAFECRQAWEKRGKTGLENGTKEYALKTSEAVNEKCS